MYVEKVAARFDTPPPTAILSGGHHPPPPILKSWQVCENVCYFEIPVSVFSNPLFDYTNFCEIALRLQLYCRQALSLHSPSVANQ